MLSIKKIMQLSVSALVLSTTVACGQMPASPLMPSPQALLASQSLQNTQPEAPPVRLRIKRAEIEVSKEELNNQFQAILKLSNEKRLVDTVIHTIPNSNTLLVDGYVKAKPWLPEVHFELTGSLTTHPNNTIRFSADKISVIGLPVKGLMDIIGLELSNIAKFKDRFGRIEQRGNDIDLIVERFTKDAIIEGQMKQVFTSQSGITVIF